MKYQNYISKIKNKFLTFIREPVEFPQTREVLPSPIREVTGKPIMDSLSCPYCFSKDFQKRGFRQKKLEKIQLYLCLSCHKTFTPQITKGKHYPLNIMLDAISIYNLGYSLEETCRIVTQRHQKTASEETVSSGLTRFGERATLRTIFNITQNHEVVKSQKGVDPEGIGPSRPTFLGSAPEPGEPTPKSLYNFALQPSTLSHWLTETTELCRFSRMREFARKKYCPKDMVISATLAHRQLYRFLFHRAKAELIIKEEFQHRKFSVLKEFLEMVPSECPHQYFQRPDAERPSAELDRNCQRVPADVLKGQGDLLSKDKTISAAGRTNSGAVFRASESPLFFSKTQMIVRAKQNYATKLAAFVLQSVKERKDRHQALQKFMLANDSVTVATEVPVYITRDDIEHMKSQLGFEIYSRPVIARRDPSLSLRAKRSNPNDSSGQAPQSSQPNNEIATATSWPRNDNNQNPAAEVARPLESASLPSVADFDSLPKLITGHIDMLQIRNGQIHILDYKPNAEKERPIEQLTLYAMALSRLTGLRLFEFKCAWFDEKDYFEFYPLHVLHKTKKSGRRRKITTDEGTYLINRNPDKIENIRPAVM